MTLTFCECRFNTCSSLGLVRVQIARVSVYSNWCTIRFRYTVSSQSISGSPMGSFFESFRKTSTSVCEQAVHS